MHQKHAQIEKTLSIMWRAEISSIHLWKINRIWSRPTSRVVSRLYRERAMEKIRTNEEVWEKQLKQVSAGKTRPNQFETWSAFHLVLFILYSWQTRQIVFFPFPMTKRKTCGNIFRKCTWRKYRKKYFNLEMERMIKQKIFALVMDALTSHLQRLQLHNKIVTLLHELWWHKSL